MTTATPDNCYRCNARTHEIYLGKSTMGGHGSTRWNGYTKKRTVEDCLTLDLRSFVRNVVSQQVWDDRVEHISTIVWSAARTGEKIADVRYRLMWQGEVPTITLHYLTDGRRVRQRINFTTDEPHLGGVRYWFRCSGCNRRCRKLHGFTGVRFLCRGCHDLSYSSTQSQRKPRTTGYMAVLHRLFAAYDDYERVQVLESKLERCRPDSKRYADIMAQLERVFEKHDTVDVE